MTKYDSYKDSEIAWMGDVPSTWMVTKNRYVLEKCDNGKNKSEDTSVLSLTKKGVAIRNVLSHGRLANSYVGHQLVEEGDIVFCPRDLDNDSILSGVSSFDGCISNLYIVDKTKDGVSNHFVNYYWYGLKYSVEYFKNFSYGMRYSFNREQFDEIPFLLPPISEQNRIVQYLDAKTAQANSLMGKCHRKIELLKEQRNSLVSKCVIKGLTSATKMKSSGVEWMGDVPSTWMVTKNRYAFQKCDNGKNKSEDTPVLTLTKKGVQVRTELSTGRLADSYIGHQLVEKGDIIFCPRDLDNDSILSGVSPFNGCISNLYIVDKTKDGVLNHFVNYYWYGLKYSVDYFKNFSYGMRYSFNREQFDEIPFLLPPLSEQKQIAAYLDNRTQQINALIAAETRRIALLTEYKESLVSSVVTGKIRVTEKML